VAVSNPVSNNKVRSGRAAEGEEFTLYKENRVPGCSDILS